MNNNKKTYQYRSLASPHVHAPPFATNSNAFFFLRDALRCAFIGKAERHISACLFS
jgi:hypothetical protein